MTMVKHFIPVLLFLAVPAHSDACTSFVISSDSTVVMAKNLDWPIGDGAVMVNPRGAVKKAYGSRGIDQMTWRSRYGSVTFNMMGRELPLGGINEKGLVIEEMSYSPSTYPSTGKPVLNEFQWVQYQLDSYSSTAEVVAHLDDISVHKMFIGLHYMICDWSGDVAVIEFTGGAALCYTGRDIIVPVLTNNSYRNSLDYLRLHEGFGGDMPVRDGPESPERFVRAASAIIRHSDAEGEPQVERAFGILGDTRQNDTQWSIVYDITGAKVHFQTRYSAGRQIIDLGAVDFSSRMIWEIPVDGSNISSIQLKPYSSAANTRLITRVMDRLAGLGEISEDEASETLEHLVEYDRLLP